MKNFKRIFVSVMVLALAAFMCGCSAPKQSTDDGISVLCGAYPQYDWVMNITAGANGVKVLRLLRDGVDIHSFQPSADDVIKIYESDLFILNGGESDDSILDIIKGNSSVKTRVLNLTEEYGGDFEREEQENDEHIWLSLKNAAAFCDKICETMSELDGDNAELYRNNTRIYKEKLNELDGRYASAISGAKRNSLVFADRFPFRYLARDYSLECFAAFPGCSSETEASFNTVLKLAGKVDELKLDTVLTVDGGKNSVADAVIGNAAADNIAVLDMNSMQAVTAEQVNGGMTYLSAMEDNLKVIMRALGCDGKED